MCTFTDFHAPTVHIGILHIAIQLQCCTLRTPFLALAVHQRVTPESDTRKCAKQSGLGCMQISCGKQLAGASRRTRKSPSCHDTNPILSTLDGFYYDKGWTELAAFLAHPLGDENYLGAEIELDNMCDRRKRHLLKIWV